MDRETRRRLCRVLLVFLGLAALAGLVCRFLLEFGEVANGVNFTAPNVLLHLLLAAGVPALWAWQPGAKRGEERQGHGA